MANPVPPTPADMRESEASGATAAIFADIRAVQRAGNVNYIWRHLATIPDALDAAWLRVKPRTGEIRDFGEAVWSRAQILARPCLGAASGLPAWPEEASRVFASYAVGNRWNLAALTLLLTGRLPDVPEAQAPQPVSGVPAIPAFDALPEPVKGAITALANAGPGADSGIRPSLWVHLGLWPETLLAIEPGLSAILRSDAFRSGHADLLEFCGRPDPENEGLPAEAVHSLKRFQRRISEMTLIGALLQPESR